MQCSTSALKIVIVAILIVAADGPVSAGGKHALLIGISNYGSFYPNLTEEQRLFPDLDCEADVRSIQAALVHTFHFDPGPAAGQITELTTPSQTTHYAIIAALQHLVDITKPGDIIYIHYSGHGDQIPDPTEPSGYDSALVPCNYLTPQPDKKTEASANEIAGKTVLSYINKLHEKGAAQIVLSFDCCHSASAARGAATRSRARGISEEQYLVWYENGYPEYQPAASQSAAELPAGAAQDDLTGAGYIVFSACRNTDRAWETDNQPVMGRLSYCLAKVLGQATPQTTFRQAFNQIYAMFHAQFPDQEPQLDGSDPDAPLLGGQAVIPPASFELLVDKTGNYTLNQGSLQDMSVGSLFALYPQTDPVFKAGTEIADGQVTAVTPTLSTLKLTWKKSGLQPSDLLAARAVESRHDYATPPLTFDTDSLHRELPDQAEAILARLTDRITGLAMVTTTPPSVGQTWDIGIARVASSDGKNGPEEVDVIRPATGTVIATLAPANGSLSDQLYSALQKEARYRYACGLGVNQVGLNRTFHLNIRIVPTDINGNAIPTSQSISSETTDRRPVIPLNSYFTIQAQNSGPRPLHVAILDLESSGEISEVWPPSDTLAQDNILTPTTANQWKTLWATGTGNTRQPAVFLADTPDSDEMYKAIGTVAAAKEGDPDEYVDFSALTSRGTSRGPANPFSDLFGPAVDSGVRGPKSIPPIDPGAWTATTLPFQVVTMNK